MLVRHVGGTAVIIESGREPATVRQRPSMGSRSRRNRWLSAARVAVALLLLLVVGGDGAAASGGDSSTSSLAGAGATGELRTQLRTGDIVTSLEDNMWVARPHRCPRCRPAPRT